ncbi:MAG: hypothetical protein U0R52_07615 [Solirubrobacterales bacterium]
MPSAEHYLLEAADSYRHESEPENRLTAILAEVLRTAPALMRWLVRKAFDVSEGEAREWTRYSDYEVDTQLRLPSGERPDMRVRFTGRSNPPGELFCESKIHADWTEWQKCGYPSVLDPSRIVVFSPDGRIPPGFTDDVRIRPITWAELARQVHQLGRAWARRASASDTWRALAMHPKVPSQYRMLAELLGYLEREEGVDVSIHEPLTQADLEIIPCVPELVATWDELFQLVVDRLSDRQGEGTQQERRWAAERGKETRGWLGWSLTLMSLPGWNGAGWPALDGLHPPPEWSWQELVLSPDGWWLGGDRQPGCGVGIGFMGAAGWPTGLEEGGALRAAVMTAGEFDFGTTQRGRIYRIFATLPLSKIASDDTNLDLQAESVADWAVKQIDALTQIA